MLDQLLVGLQGDLKILLWAPLMSAIFRFIFIRMYGPGYTWSKDKGKLITAFRFAFWWGMDFHAYVLLGAFLFVTLPGAFIDTYFAWGNIVKTIVLTMYLLVLYAAFMGKLIFYYHFKDIYNDLVRLGGNADKMNFLDIFFNENHGGWILGGIIPYCALVGMGIYGTLMTPVWHVGQLPFWIQIVGMVVAVLVTVAFFYWLRYGGTFKHRDKPEWDVVPTRVKEDMFLAKATVDDLIALEMVYKKRLDDVLGLDDQDLVKTMKKISQLSGFNPSDNPLDYFIRQAQGPRISKPKHIFFLVGESLTQSVLDPIYKDYHISDAGKVFQGDAHTISLQNFLPAGMISQPAITSLMAGIYDCNFEINENRLFWEHTLATSLPEQIKKLGYQTKLWYGGDLSWASLGLYGNAIGFDQMFGGPDICGKDAPATWLGVYDHIFLEEVKERIFADSDKPTMHFIYTTSNHAPTTIPIEKYGWDADKTFGNIPESIRKNKGKVADLGTYWYTEKALFDFANALKEKFEDSLIVVTGDHSYRIADGLLPDRSDTLRERLCTYFAMYHKDIDSHWVDPEGIGTHLQIMPTLFELLAPQGFTYYSIVPSLFAKVDEFVTPYHWLRNQQIGYFRDAVSQDLRWRDGQNSPMPPLQRDCHELEEERNAYIALTAWMLKHPDLLVKR